MSCCTTIEINEPPFKSKQINSSRNCASGKKKIAIKKWFFKSKENEKTNVVALLTGCCIIRLDDGWWWIRHRQMQCNSLRPWRMTWRDEPIDVHSTGKKEMERLIFFFFFFALLLYQSTAVFYRLVGGSLSHSPLSLCVIHYKRKRERENNNLCRPSRFEFIIPFSLSLSSAISKFGYPSLSTVRVMMMMKAQPGRDHPKHGKPSLFFFFFLFSIAKKKKKKKRSSRQVLLAPGPPSYWETLESQFRKKKAIGQFEK